MSRFAYGNFGEAGKYDAVVGTRRGCWDSMLLYSNELPQAFERTFSLLTQVVGRSGRFDLPGRAFIETAQPSNRVSCAGICRVHTGRSCFQQVNLYPPFCSLLTVQFFLV